jgi:hypothetical protein
MANASTWAKRVSAWRSSGQTADAFASGRGFAGGTLRWWASRLARRPPALVRVVAAPSPSAASVELEVGGISVRVRPGFDGALLSQVLDVLAARGGA